MKIRLITENYFKDNSPVTENVQMKDIYPHIDAAQDINLRQILGSEFFKYIKGKYDTQILTPNEIILMRDYIQPSVLYRTLAYALPFMQFNLRNKGVMVNTDDAANAAGFSEFKFLLQTVKDRAENNEELLRLYLHKNTELYPEYKLQNGLTPPDNSTNFDGGLIFY